MCSGVTRDMVAYVIVVETVAVGDRPECVIPVREFGCLRLRQEIEFLDNSHRGPTQRLAIVGTLQHLSLEDHPAKRRYQHLRLRGDSQALWSASNDPSFDINFYHHDSPSR
jgi:hypothetical protein